MNEIKMNWNDATKYALSLFLIRSHFLSMRETSCSVWFWCVSICTLFCLSVCHIQSLIYVELVRLELHPSWYLISYHDFDQIFKWFDVKYINEINTTVGCLLFVGLLMQNAIFIKFFFQYIDSIHSELQMHTKKKAHLI